MELEFTEEQQMLKKMAREFLEIECPKTLVRAMEKDEKGYSPELWKKMVDLGWMGLAFPEQYGGSGLKFLDLTILIEEMGRALLPAPFLSTVVLCGLPILFAGREEQRQEFIPKIAKGEIILTLALTEPDARYEVDAIKVRAKRDGDSFAINGTKLFVADAHIAHYLLCVTRTEDGAAPEGGITLFLVDTKSPGLRCSSLVDTIGRDKQFEVAFNKVKVSRNNALGELNKGWRLVQQILTYGAVAECARMLGCAQQVLDMVVAYAKERVTFGRPIGSYQQIQRYCADMITDIDACRYLTYQAAWKLSEGLPCTPEVSTAKAWVSDASQRVCVVGHQIFGGIGFTTDHDMGLYYRRAKMQELNFGDGDFHREVIAQELGL